MDGRRHLRICAVPAGLLFAALLPPSRPQAPELPAGLVIERVTCKGNGGQSYALFLPSAYSPDRRWPIVYALDAGARGRVPVDRFKEAAERYGYILAGSNNSRNGPVDAAVAAVQAMFDDTRSRVSIDGRRVYVAGFSGGARLAVTVATSVGGGVAGVIGCSGGLPVHIKPSAALPFAYFGTAGTEDFAYPEMRQLDRAMDASGVRHRFAVFEGAHDWPPASLCTSAIEWMELQAMRSGDKARNEAFLDDLLRKTAQIAASDEASGRIYDALLEYEALARDFTGLRDVSQPGKRADELRGSKALQQDVRKERDEEENQNRWMTRLMGLKAGYVGADDPGQVLLDLNSAIHDLNTRADGKQASDDRRVARRVRSLFLVVLSEEARDQLASRDYASAAFAFSIALRVRPDNPRLLYNLACAQALGGKKGDALATLRRATANGFADVAALETDPSLDTLRADRAFRAIIANLKKRQ